jgi:hypothetical protein
VIFARGDQASLAGKIGSIDIYCRHIAGELKFADVEAKSSQGGAARHGA